MKMAAQLQDDERSSQGLPLDEFSDDESLTFEAFVEEEEENRFQMQSGYDPAPVNRKLRTMLKKPPEPDASSVAAESKTSKTCSMTASNHSYYEITVPSRVAEGRFSGSYEQVVRVEERTTQVSRVVQNNDERWDGASHRNSKASRSRKQSNAALRVPQRDRSFSPGRGRDGGVNRTYSNSSARSSRRGSMVEAASVTQPDWKPYSPNCSFRSRDDGERPAFSLNNSFRGRRESMTELASVTQPDWRGEDGYQSPRPRSRSPMGGSSGSSPRRGNRPALSPNSSFRGRRESMTEMASVTQPDWKGEDSYSPSHTRNSRRGDRPALSPNNSFRGRRESMAEMASVSQPDWHVSNNTYSPNSRPALAPSNSFRGRADYRPVSSPNSSFRSRDDRPLYSPSDSFRNRADDRPALSSGNSFRARRESEWQAENTYAPHSRPALPTSSANISFRRLEVDRQAYAVANNSFRSQRDNWPAYSPNDSFRSRTGDEHPRYSPNESFSSRRDDHPVRDSFGGRNDWVAANSPHNSIKSHGGDDRQSLGGHGRGDGHSVSRSDSFRGSRPTPPSQNSVRHHRERPTCSREHSWKKQGRPGLTREASLKHRFEIARQQSWKSGHNINPRPSYNGESSFSSHNSEAIPKELVVYSNDEHYDRRESWGDDVEFPDSDPHHRQHQYHDHVACGDRQQQMPDGYARGVPRRPLPRRSHTNEDHHSSNCHPQEAARQLPSRSRSYSSTQRNSGRHQGLEQERHLQGARRKLPHRTESNNERGYPTRREEHFHHEAYRREEAYYQNRRMPHTSGVRTTYSRTVEQNCQHEEWYEGQDEESSKNRSTTKQSLYRQESSPQRASHHSKSGLDTRSFHGSDSRRPDSKSSRKMPAQDRRRDLGAERFHSSWGGGIGNDETKDIRTSLPFDDDDDFEQESAGQATAVKQRGSLFKRTPSSSSLMSLFKRQPSSKKLLPKRAKSDLDKPSFHGYDSGHSKSEASHYSRKMPAVENTDSGLNDEQFHSSWAGTNNHNHNHRKSRRNTSRNTRASASSSNENGPLLVEIFPGVEAPLRRAYETKDAIENNFYIPVSCMACCSLDLYAIADVSYFICPVCKTVGSVEEDGDFFHGRPIHRHGLGLGFTRKTLFETQSELMGGSGGGGGAAKSRATSKREH